MQSSTREKLLIIGAPARSGNHLLRGLLDGHPELLLPPDEDYFVRHLLRRPLYHFLGACCPSSLAPRFYRWLQKNGHLERVNSGSRRLLQGTENSLDLESYYATVRTRHGRTVTAMIDAHFEGLSRALGASISDGRRKVLFCALQPNNRDLSNLGRSLSRCYDLRAIFVVRDPRAHFSSKVARNPGTKLRTHCRRLNHYWRQIEEFSDQFAPALRVRFEDLVADTEATMRSVCEFAGLRFLPLVTEFTRLGQPAYSNSSYLPMQGVDSEVLTRYRSILDQNVISQIERFSLPQLLWEGE